MPDVSECRITRSPHAAHGLLINEAAREVALDGVSIELTKTEFELLVALHNHPRQVMTPDVLLTILWDSNFINNAHPIEVYVHRLRTKLGESGKHPRFIHTVRGVGYRFEPDSVKEHTVALTYHGAGELVSIDPAVPELWGWPAQEILGQRFVPIDDRVLHQCKRMLALVSMFESFLPRFHLDTHIVQRDGRALPVQALINLDPESQQITAVVAWHSHSSRPSRSSTATEANRTRQSLMP